MIVDVHTHVWESPDQLGPELAALLRARASRPWQRPDAAPADHDEAMGPVDRALVLGFVSKRLGALVSAAEVARYVASRPDNYLGLAGIDPSDDRWHSMLEEACVLGLRGAVIAPAAQGFEPACDRAMLLYEECQRRRLPVVVESFANACPSAVLEYSRPLLFDVVLRSFPGLCVLFTGLGEPGVDETLALLGKHPHAYADLSGLVKRPWQLYQMLLAASERGVIGKLLLGSGFPLSTPERAMAAVLRANDPVHNCGLPAVPRVELEAIVHRDALSCLGLGVEAGPANVAGLSALTSEVTA
jgi:uncharacterized protein